MKPPTARRERPFAQVRKDLGLDLHRAAARLRVNPHYLRTLELGRAPLSYALAQRMAGEYGTSIQALTRPVRAGGTGEEGREVSGNTSRPAGSERGPSAGQLRLLRDLGFEGETPVKRSSAAELIRELLEKRREDG